MGAASACCVKREADSKERLERHHSWQSVDDPDDFLAFFDCIEGEGAPQDPTLVRTGSDPRVGKRRTWLDLNKGEADPPASVPAAPATDPGEAASVASVTGTVRELWLARVSAGDLDDELAQRVREGFPELDAWTTPATVRRMLCAACGDEGQAVGILDKAIACRLRRRALFQTMRCRVTCDARVIGSDLQQRPVVYMSCASQAAPLGEMLPQLFLAFEAAVRIGHPEGQMMLIADMAGLKVRPNMDRHAVRELSDSFGTVFADRLNFILIVDFSFVAQALWSLCQPFLSERTRSKIQFVSEEEARALCSRRLAAPTCARVLSAFDISRDATSTAADREAHAKRTSICDVPLGVPPVNEAG